MGCNIHIMAKIGDKEFTVMLDIHTYKLLHDEMRAVHQELSRLRDCPEMDERLTAKVDLLPELFVGIAGSKTNSLLD